MSHQVIPKSKKLVTEIAGCTPVEARKKACQSLWFLCTEILGWRFLSEGLHRPLCDWIDEPYEEHYRMLLWPRWHCKTTIFTQAEMIQGHLKDSDQCFGLGSYKKVMAEKMLYGIKDQYRRCENLRVIAPDVCWDNPDNDSPVWTRDQIELKRARIGYKVPSIYCMGKDASATSLHFTKLKLDDIVVEENEGSPAMLQETFEWVQTLEGVLDPLGAQKVDLAGTRWRHNDSYGLMLDDPNISGQIRKSIRSILEDEHGKPDYPTGEPIWKDSKNFGKRDQVLALEKRVTSFRFWAFCMNSPIPKGSVVFNMDDVDVRYMEADGEGANMRPRLPERHPDGRAINYQFFTAVDPNTEDNNANDPAVVLTVAIDDRAHFWLCRMDRGHPNQSVLIDWIGHHHKMFAPKCILIEAVAHQRTLAYWLKQAAATNDEFYRIFPIRKRSESHYSRIITLQELTENRRLHIPNWRMFEPLIAEMKVYTEAAKIDDCLDTLADIYAYGSKPPENDQVKIPRPKSPVTIDAILGRMAHVERAITERDSMFDKRGIHLTRRLFHPGQPK